MIKHFITPFIFLLALLIIIVFFKALFRKQARPSNTIKKGDYRAKTVLTEIEQVLFHRLQEALPEYIVLAQVAMSQILRPTGKNRTINFRRISQKTLDFVICKKDFSILAAIELDDASHENIQRQKADSVKNSALDSADIRLLRWQATHIPDIAAIRSILITP